MFLFSSSSKTPLYRFIISEESLFFESINKSLGNDKIKILYAGIENASATKINDVINVSSDIDFRLKIMNLSTSKLIMIGYDLKTIKGDVVFGSGYKLESNLQSITELKCEIPANFLNNNVYQIHLYIHTADRNELFQDTEFLTFEVKDVKRESGYLGKVNGFIRPELSWTVINKA